MGKENQFTQISMLEENQFDEMIWAWTGWTHHPNYTWTSTPPNVSRNNPKIEVATPLFWSSGMYTHYLNLLNQHPRAGNQWFSWQNLS
jgi:hypothetical protein